MPEVEYATTMDLEPETIWDFIKDMNNWAPFLTGYQSHEVLSETDSIWTLKGDVGMLVRSIRMKVHITEWNGPQRVSFTLTGINEEMEGGGTFVMGRAEPVSTTALATAPNVGFFSRIIDAIVRFFFRRAHGPAPQRRAPGGGQASKLTFTLRMDAGGPTAPLVNAMLGPALRPAAEDLANKIAAHLEKAHAVKVTGT